MAETIGIFNDLTQGQQFRFITDPINVVRTASQIGRIEIYCPIDGSNTMGHSKEGGEEVYLKNNQKIILLTQDNKATEDLNQTSNFKLIKYLESEGYTDVREIPKKGVCGLMKFVFYTGLCYGLNERGLEGYYSFEFYLDARQALESWNGEGDPEGNWIKRKGDVEYLNPKTNS